MIHTSIHLVVSESEQLAIVNALAFYNDYHAGEISLEHDDSLEQWRMAFVEDNGGLDLEGPVDKLATKIASYQ